MIVANGMYALDLRVAGKTYPIGDGRVQYVRIYENVFDLGPTAELIVDDRLNLILETLPFTGNEDIEIGFGTSEQDIQYHTFKVFKSYPVLSSDVSRFHFELYSKSIDSLIAPMQYKSYEASKVSDVVAAIALDVGMEYEVEVTSDVAGTWFCPGWSYATFLRFLVENARSSGYATSGYLCFVDLVGKLCFYSTDYAMRRLPENGRLNLSVIIEDEDIDKPLYEMRASFYNGQILPRGGLGLTTDYYDWETGTFSSYPLTIDQTKHSGMSNYLAILSDDLDASTHVRAAARVESAFDLQLLKNESEDQLVRMVDSLVRMEVLIDGNLDLHSGRKVAITLPSAYPQAKINAALSGEWLIERITHVVLPRFASKLVLARSGVDAGRDAKLVSPHRRVTGDVESV